MMVRFLRVTSMLLLASAALAVEASAETVYVDNLAGSDAFDGSSAEPRGGSAGPVRTIARGLAIARGHDTVTIANHGVPYYESMAIAGGRLQGGVKFPFTVMGNGAIVEGSRLVPASAWTPAGDNVWKMTPYRKGAYQLILDDRPVPGTVVGSNTEKLPEIAAGEWAAWKGSYYLRVPPQTEPRDQPYQFAALEVGLTLHAVKNVRISDLTFRNFRLDGVNAHDRARNIELVNVTATGNGRAGVSIGGTSNARLLGCDLTGNRGSSLQLLEFGLADVEATKLDADAQRETSGSDSSSPSTAQPLPQ